MLIRRLLLTSFPDDRAESSRSADPTLSRNLANSLEPSSDGEGDGGGDGEGGGR
eukprot:CAMPEP_0169452240 /NCGR_PEP_ID=MMETSP1042-20121227/14138_1 /TAXON_ID=464988 /ORGANISM="Hemiselmis andersenii, Strain CCMP1180" /LENGTH=53 /DNA_ID=CAMNT_0009564231 /DNA_START=287 /DNA_END=448 /DNA_ORIENTATION=+